MPDSRFLDTAARIAHRLCRDALWSGNECNWLGWSMDVFGRSWQVVYKAQSPMLYDGTAGIAVFLARMDRATGEPVVADTATAAMNQAFSALGDLPEEVRPSVYSGALGIAYAAVEAGAALGDERMAARGRRDAVQFGRPTPKAVWVDVIGGSAGSIQA